MIALLGKRYVANDGIYDYCDFLGQALARHSVSLTIANVSWSEDGWRRALLRLWRESANWRGEWVLLQYTALGWSRRGFPWGALAAEAIVRRRGARCAVVFHEHAGYGGSRWRERVRNACQMWVLRRLYRKSAASIFTVPLDRVGWLPLEDAEPLASHQPRRAVFIPIGANIPEPPDERKRVAANSLDREMRIAVFGVRYAPAAATDVAAIACVAREASEAIPNLRVVVLGRGSSEAQEALAAALERSSVSLEVRGSLSAEEIAHELAQADALLFVRSAITLQRGTAVAAIACGLPIVGYGSGETGGPMAESGIEWAASQDPKALAAAVVRLLTDPKHWMELHERNLRVHERYFSWSRIAELYVETLAK